MIVHNHSKNTSGQLPLYGTILQLFLFLLPAGFFISCKKEKDAPGSAMLTMVNTVVGSRPLAVNFNNDGPVPYNTGRRLNYKAYGFIDNQFRAYSGSQRLRLYQYPDTTSKDLPLFDLQLDLPVGSINSLFLTGTVDAPDTFFTRDVIPFFPAADNAMAIRFVNLSPGSDPVSINLIGLANGSEVSTIAYKSITGFRNYPVNTSISKYVFEFRNAVSGDLITSYSLSGIDLPGDEAPNRWKYHSFTLALVGEPGGIGMRAQAGFIVDHY